MAKRAGLVPVIGAGNSKLLMRRLRAFGPNVRGVISLGIAGALAPLPEVGDAVIASHVVAGYEHYACDPGWSRVLRTKLPEAHSVVVAGVELPAQHMGAKKDLFRETGAHAVDMESHVAARFAVERGIPFVVLRTISDDAHRTLPPAVLERLSINGNPRYFAIMRSMLRERGQLRDLIRTASEARVAFAALLRCLEILGPGLGCPYLG